MSARRVSRLDRSPYAVLPDPRRPPDLRIGFEVRDAVATFGPSAVEPIVRRAVRRSVTGRASCPAEVALLREYVATVTEETVARMLARMTGGTPEDAHEVEDQAEEAVAGEVALRTCSTCGALFGVPAGSRRGRPRSRCYSCSPERSPRSSSASG